jgi:hypothetical protein
MQTKEMCIILTEGHIGKKDKGKETSNRELFPLLQFILVEFAELE